MAETQGPTLRSLRKAQVRRQEARLEAWRGLVPGSAWLSRRSALNSDGVFNSSEPVAEGEDLLTSPAATPSKAFGVNHVRAFVDLTLEGASPCSSRGGVDADPFEDAVRIGADRVRHAGPCDLYWHSLAASGNARLKLVGGPVPFGPAALKAALDPPSNQQEVALALRAARDLGLKLSLTFMHNGGGNNEFAGTPPSDATCPSQVGWSDTDALDNVPQLQWAEDHVGASSPSGLFDFPLDSLGGDPSCLWHLDSLDVSSPYKREYLGLIAENVGLWLTALESRLGFALDEVITSIEMFNEVDARCTYNRDGSSYDPARTGDAWGRAVAWSAAGLRRGLSGSQGGDSIALFLPAMSSYQGSFPVGSGRTWIERLQTLEALVAGFVSEVTLLGVDANGPLPAELVDLPGLIQGMDYHFYHRKAEATHITMLRHEVAAIQQAIAIAFDNAVGAALRTDLAGTLNGLPITVAENGVSVCDIASGGACGSGPEWRPPGYGSTMQEGERFQANEVIRRLCGALASEAVLAGWHAWQSGVPNEENKFTGSGLRYDLTDSGAPASDAEPRPSWLAYRRLVDVLGPVWEGSVVLPTARERSELKTWLESSSERERARTWCTVLELRAGQPSSWYYLLLFEPVVPGDVQLVLTASASAGGGLLVQEIDLDPGHYQMHLPPCDLPTGFLIGPSYSSDSDVPLPASWSLRPGDDPVLLRSEMQLSWECSHAISVLDQLAPDLDIPRWDDDWLDFRREEVWEQFFTDLNDPVARGW